MGKDYENSRRRVKRVMLSLSIGLIVLSVMLIFMFNAGEPGLGERLLNEVVTGILFAGVTVCFMNVANWIIFKDDMDEKHDEDVARRIWNLLKAEQTEDSIITRLYDEEAAELVMRNSIAYFNKKLANDFCNLISVCSKVLRENQSYEVRISRHLEKRCYIFQQEIGYTRHFLAHPGKSFMRCGFALSNNALDTILNDTSFFFREVISDEDMRRDIVEYVRNGELLKIQQALHFHMYLYRGARMEVQNNVKIYIKGVDSTDYDTAVTMKEFDRETDVIIFEVEIPNEFLMDSINGMKCYKGSIKFRYDVPPTTNFYCAFADTMVGTTKFRIYFEQGIIDRMKHILQFITFLTCGPKKSNLELGEGTVVKDNITRFDDGAMYETDETIFPRSGLVVNWDPDDMNK